MRQNSEIALLTGGADQPYAFGLTAALSANGVELDVICGDDLDVPRLRRSPGVRLLNLRGNQRSDVPAVEKMRRVLAYYARLIRYAASAQPRIFHILWNNKFEAFDRTLLTLYYRLLGKKLVLTVHNVNAGTRDGNDSWLNRVTLKIQYRLCDYLFVHTEKMKAELVQKFGVPESAVGVIPFGINNAAPNTALTPAEARQHLGIAADDKVMLFFGTIAPYKGLEYLVDAFQRIATDDPRYRLVIAGRPRKDGEQYWARIRESIAAHSTGARVTQHIAFIPDEYTERYFKAADVLILPYRHIFQSGVLFLSYSFGLPVIATDVGSMKDDVVPGETGFLCATGSADDLAASIDRFFNAPLFRDLAQRRPLIRERALKKHSWEIVAKLTRTAYRQLTSCPAMPTNSEVLN